MGRGIEPRLPERLLKFDQDNGQRVENINFILDIETGKVEELISYNHLLEHLENAQDHVIQFPPKMVENWWRYELVNW